MKVSTTRLLLLDSDIADILTDQARTDFSADEKGRAVETVILDAQTESLIASGSPFRAPDEQRSGVTVTALSLLIFTSGTTGLPKAANVAWGKTLSGVNFFPKLLELKQEDRYHTAMPLYHSSASILGVCQALGVGSTVIVSPNFLAAGTDEADLGNKSHRHAVHWRDVSIHGVQSSLPLRQSAPRAISIWKRHATGGVAEIQGIFSISAPFVSFTVPRKALARPLYTVTTATSRVQSACRDSSVASFRVTPRFS